MRPEHEYIRLISHRAETLRETHSDEGVCYAFDHVEFEYKPALVAGSRHEDVCPGSPIGTRVMEEFYGYTES